MHPFGAPIEQTQTHLIPGCEHAQDFDGHSHIAGPITPGNPSTHS